MLRATAPAVAPPPAAAAKAGASLMWVAQPKKNGTFGAVMFGQSNVARRHKGTARSKEVEPTVYIPEGPLSSLSEIPAESWEHLAEPPDEGYQYRAWVHYVVGALWAIEALSLIHISEPTRPY